MQVQNGYLGTYFSAQSAGIYRFQFDSDTGIITEPELYYTAPDSKYLSLSHGLLASPLIKEGEQASALTLQESARFWQVNYLRRRKAPVTSFRMTHLSTQQITMREVSLFTGRKPTPSLLANALRPDIRRAVTRFCFTGIS